MATDLLRYCIDRDGDVEPVCGCIVVDIECLDQGEHVEGVGEADVDGEDDGGGVAAGDVDEGGGIAEDEASRWGKRGGASTNHEPGRSNQLPK